MLFRSIYSVAQIISFASQSFTLLLGDVILTGMFFGVGSIYADDQLETAIDNWPRLRNNVVIAHRVAGRNAEESSEMTI